MASLVKSTSYDAIITVYSVTFSLCFHQLLLYSTRVTLLDGADIQSGPIIAARRYPDNTTHIAGSFARMSLANQSTSQLRVSGTQPGARRIKDLATIIRKKQETAIILAGSSLLQSSSPVHH